MSIETRDTDSPRYDSVFFGEVVDTADELGIGRVRVFVPGLIEPGAWALPLGAMCGVQSGVFFVPEVGSNVAVFFHQGDVDFPCYIPGNFGKPDGVSDVPSQAANGDPNIAVMRWRGFSIVFDATNSAEKMTIEDVVSGSKIEIDRQTKDITETVKGDRISTIEGSRTSSIAKDQTVAIKGDVTYGVDGDETRSIKGKRTETVLGDDTCVAAGQKSITASALSISTTGPVALTSASSLSLSGSSVAVIGSGPGSEVHSGLKTETFLGGLISNITGDFASNISGILKYVVTGAAMLIGSDIKIGNGPYLPLLNKNFHDVTFASHIHLDPVSGQTGPAVFAVNPNDITSHLKAS